eukprot:CAMPEP_0183745140 /NCGR_PEP_ID=MMETSP0737-20130205/66088_1 /TAXON_ID=385413 /ORGANISM="Thalassiosira miniscula, Strain CCMP1093" /LENGTH=485 /DNA_ID=CAMNT_0025980799 /DNA_START=1345 /DNA_END=2802 /DNA_ORIENTATION=-
MNNNDESPAMQTPSSGDDDNNYEDESHSSSTTSGSTTSGSRGSNHDDNGKPQQQQPSRQATATATSPEAEPQIWDGKSPWPRTNIAIPGIHDCLMGRGGGTNHHPGNKRFRAMTEAKKPKYLASKRLDKPIVAMEIIHEWRALHPPGRFLKQDAVTKMWYDVGDQKAREKTSQALREKISYSVNEKCTDKRGVWTEEEKSLVIHAQSELGNRWNEVAKRIPGRSEISVKNWWYNNQTSQKKRPGRGTTGSSSKTAKNVSSDDGIMWKKRRLHPPSEEHDADEDGYNDYNNYNYDGEEEIEAEGMQQQPQGEIQCTQRHALIPQPLSMNHELGKVDENAMEYTAAYKQTCGPVMEHSPRTVANISERGTPLSSKNVRDATAASRNQGIRMNDKEKDVHSQQKRQLPVRGRDTNHQQQILFGDIGYSFRRRLEDNNGHDLGWHFGNVVDILSNTNKDRRCLYYENGFIEDLSMSDLKELAQLERKII